MEKPLIFAEKNASLPRKMLFYRADIQNLVLLIAASFWQKEKIKSYKQLYYLSYFKTQDT